MSGMGKDGKYQKRSAAKDAARLSKDSATIRRDIKNNRFITVSATAKDMDRTLRLLDQQMAGLEQIKQKNRDNLEIQKTVKAQKEMLKAQRREIRLMRKKKRFDKKSNKYNVSNKPDTSIANMFPVVDYKEK